MEWLKSALLWSGLPFVVNRYYYDRHLTILTYHGVIAESLPVADWIFIDVNLFEKQMRFIKRHFQVVKLSEGIHKLFRGEIKQPTLAITFDDGFYNNYSVAYPILKRLGIPATIFLVTGLVDSDDTVWSCRVNDALANTSKTEFVFQGKTYAIATKDQKAVVNKLLQNKLKGHPPDVLRVMFEALAKALGIDPRKKFPPHSPFRMLDRGAIREMAESGSIEFGCHTHRHCILTHLSASDRRAEISRSKRLTEDLVQGECRLFAYPNGGRDDIPAHCDRILADCGISAAVTTIRGKNSLHTPVAMFKRCGAGAWQPWADFKLMVLGAKDFAKSGINYFKSRLWRPINE